MEEIIYFFKTTLKKVFYQEGGFNQFLHYFIAFSTELTNSYNISIPSAPNFAAISFFTAGWETEANFCKSEAVNEWIFHYRTKWCPEFPVMLLLIVSYYSQINIIE